MYRFVFPLIAGIALFVSLRPLHAEPLVELPVVEVTAERAKEPLFPGDVDLSQHPGFVSSVNHQQFDDKVSDLAGVLKTLTGTQIRQLGGLGSYSRVLVRGASSNQVSVYWDDMLLNDAAGASVDLSMLPLTGVNTVDVYRGLVPLNFGLNAPGGVVHIRTRRANGEQHRTLKAGYGAFGSRSLSAYVDDQLSNFGYAVTGEFLSSDNNYPTRNSNSTPYNSQDDYTDPRHNAGFLRYNLITKLDWSTNSNGRIQGMGATNHKSEKVPSPNNGKDANAGLETSNNRAELVFLYDLLDAFSIETKSYVGISTQSLEYRDIDRNVGLRAQHNIYDSRSWHVDTFAEHFGKTDTLAFHALLRSENFEEQDLLENTSQPIRNRLYASASIQDQIRFAQDAVSLLLGNRSYRLSSETAGERASAIWRQNPEFGISWRIHPQFLVKATAAEYYREPTFYELYGSHGYFGGNKALKAERAQNIDFGAKAQGSIVDSWLRGWSWENAIFSSDIRNGIATIYDSQGVGHAINVSRTRNRGVESETQLDFGDTLSASLSATWQQPINLAESAIEDKTLLLPGRFPLSIKGRTEANSHGHRTFIEILFEDGMYYDSLNLLPAPARKLVNIGYSLHRGHVTTAAEIRNITNQRYEDFSRQPQPGLSWNLSIQYEFGSTCKRECQD